MRVHLPASLLALAIVASIPSSASAALQLGGTQDVRAKRLTLNLYSGSNGEVKTVNLHMGTRDNEGVTYTLPGRLLRLGGLRSMRLDGSMGRFGSVDMRFVPRGATKTYATGCRNKPRGKTQAGSLRGTLRLKTQTKLKTLTVRRIGAQVYDAPRTCDTGPAEPVPPVTMVRSILIRSEPMGAAYTFSAFGWDNGTRGVQLSSPFSSEVPGMQYTGVGRLSTFESSGASSARLVGSRLFSGTMSYQATETSADGKCSKGTVSGDFRLKSRLLDLPPLTFGIPNPIATLGGGEPCFFFGGAGSGGA